LGAFRPAQALHAFGDGARRYEDDLLACGPELGYLRGPARNGVMIQAAALVGDQGRPDLDHEPPCCSDCAFACSGAAHAACSAAAASARNLAALWHTPMQPSPLIADTL